MAGKKKAKKKVTKAPRKKASIGKKISRVVRKATKKVARVGKTIKTAVKRNARRPKSEIVAILREAHSLGSNAEVIRSYKLSPATFYAWKRKYSSARSKRR